MNLLYYGYLFLGKPTLSWLSLLRQTYSTIATCSEVNLPYYGHQFYGRPTLSWLPVHRSAYSIMVTDRFMVKAMCVVQLKDRKRSMDLMFMLGLNETIDQLAMANSVCCYGHV